MVIKYNNIFHSKALPNFTKIGIFGLKTNHLATLFSRRQHFQGAPVAEEPSLAGSVKQMACQFRSLHFFASLAQGSGPELSVHLSGGFSLK
jgi:hypothetical protein